MEIPTSHQPSDNNAMHRGRESGRFHMDDHSRGPARLLSLSHLGEQSFRDISGPWNRKCPDCNSIFTSVQSTGICPACQLVFNVDPDAAHSSSYVVSIAFLFVDSADVCLARVEERVRKGGDPVPESDIRRKFTRSISNFWNIYYLS